MLATDCGLQLVEYFLKGRRVAAVSWSEFGGEDNHFLALLDMGVVVDQTHRAMSDVELTVAVFLRLVEMAGDKNLQKASIFLDQFGVEKPSFKLNQKFQASLF